MLITLNGQVKAIREKTTLNDMIMKACHDSNHVIAELNGSIVKKYEWEKTLLKNKDILELVNFVGGG